MFIMSFKVLCALFLTHLVVKVQNADVCPAGSCSANDDPCKDDVQCGKGFLCCALGGFKCCKAPLAPPTPPTPPPTPPPSAACPSTSCSEIELPCRYDSDCQNVGHQCCALGANRCCRDVCPSTSCSINDLPCNAESDCKNGLSCCVLGGEKCCKGTPVSPGVCPTTSCSENDQPCRSDGECQNGLCCDIGGNKCCKVPVNTDGCSCKTTDTPCLSDTSCAPGTSCCLDTAKSAYCCKPVSTTPTTSTSTTTAMVHCGSSDLQCFTNTQCEALKKTCTVDPVTKLKCCL